MTDEVGLVESDVVVDAVAAPQKMKQKPMVMGYIMSVCYLRNGKECRARGLRNESMYLERGMKM